MSCHPGGDEPDPGRGGQPNLFPSHQVQLLQCGSPAEVRAASKTLADFQRSRVLSRKGSGNVSVETCVKLEGLMGMV